MRGVIVEVSARRFDIPFECPCCGATPPSSELAVTSKATGQSLLFPYCKRCAAHVRAWDASGIASAGTMVLGIAASVAIALAAKLVLGLLVFVASASLAWWLRLARRKAAAGGRVESCAATGVAVEYLGWSGVTSTFTFESPTFAARFAEQNKAVVANETPRLRKLLDGYRKARLAVPTPAVAAGVAPPPLNEREWLARLESTEGTVARRVQLQRALEMVDEALPRRELIQAVARIELAPLLAKLSRLTSPAAKKALLQSSIAQIQADNIAEELQATEVQQLQARLSELG